MANYPSAQNTDALLYIGVNNLSTVLTDNPLSAGATTVNVSDASSFPSVGILTIDLEAIHYTGTTATSFTGCTRGFDGTTGASHPVNTTVFHDIPAAHHNVLKDEIQAVSDDLRDIFTGDLDDSVTPAATGGDLKIRMDHFATQLKNITGEADWKTNPAETLTSLESSKAEDSLVAHLAGVETITGAKTFTSDITIDRTASAFMEIDRGSTSNEGMVRFLTAGTTSAGIGLDNDSTENLSFFTNNDFGTPKLTLLTGGSLQASNGGAANPSYAFLNGSALGFYRAGTNQIGVSTAGTIRWSFDADGVFASNNGSVIELASGTEALPGLAFGADIDTGVRLEGNNTGELVAGGVRAVRWDNLGAGGGLTRFWLYDIDNGQMERVSVGIADSGGTNFKLLRIAN